MKLRPALNAAAETTFISENFEMHEDVVPFSDRLPAINRAEHTIFHIGNNVSMHSAIWQLSTVKRGIVVLHDLRLQHLFAGIFLAQFKSEKMFLDVIERFYGDAGRKAGKDYRAGRMGMNELAAIAPMTELACMNAAGVITHSEAESERLDALGVPVRRLNLPHPVNPLDPDLARGGQEEIQLLVFGYISENRCLEEIIIALGRSRAKNRLRLFVAGTVSSEMDLEAIAARHGVSGRIDFLGYLEDQELDRWLQSVDLVFNLRYPSMGEASSAQLRIWANGAPSVVTNLGWYRDLPEDTVLRVSPERQPDDIESILNALVSDRRAFESTGRRGREHLKRNHSPDDYAAGIIEACRASRSHSLGFCDFHVIDNVRRKAAKVVEQGASASLYPGLARVLSKGRDTQAPESDGVSLNAAD